MAKTIQHIALVVFVISVTILTIIAILAIWEFLSDDVLFKTLSTLGIVTFASLIVIIAAKVIERHQEPPASLPPQV
ncbi:MAG: hypothetical protein AAB420_04285 [Patescibacteria group bacterium]